SRAVRLGMALSGMTSRTYRAAELYKGVIITTAAADRRCQHSLMEFLSALEAFSNRRLGVGVAAISRSANTTGVLLARSHDLVKIGCFGPKLGEHPLSFFGRQERPVRFRAARRQRG
ncbi:hypothetical protein, partial [Mesorhizobium sp. M0488]|uniref:hypothetical protein n=1 Tax=Mesorhizobium sp. M0488 TaxID=2956949 RepID=UPI003337FFE4